MEQRGDGGQGPLRVLQPWRDVSAWWLCMPAVEAASLSLLEKLRQAVGDRGTQMCDVAPL